ncbi:MAG: ATP--guanido phosphotransferase, partial [Halanaerobiales bacterium]
SGNIYQISNQITLGNSEKEIIDNLKSVMTQIIEEERKTRHKLMENKKDQVVDKIMRSYGILRYAHKISEREAMEHLSSVKLGIDMGIIDSLDTKIMSELMILIRHAHLQKIVQQELDANKRGIQRALLIRNRLEERN